MQALITSTVSVIIILIVSFIMITFFVYILLYAAVLLIRMYKLLLHEYSELIKGKK